MDSQAPSARTAQTNNQPLKKPTVRTTASDHPNNRPGGFIKPPPPARQQRIKWTADNDRKLLLFALGRHPSGKESQAIADWFDEKPTGKAIQERLTKLRAEQRRIVAEAGIEMEGVEGMDGRGGDGDGEGNGGGGGVGEGMGGSGEGGGVVDQPEGSDMIVMGQNRVEAREDGPEENAGDK
ncbi:hypothetical protein BAUCODRAFT_146525 [Baudoinia panamericana UAMH 10762]|uniref:Uncharacterized protein n=1 Tax=Baudoinia panamericana (strain UAMH 10762) TaxID=717646 RepID=M2N1W9_BAUPA|nr:uncharacterized protein BAUCODRAFT_146525 [Baudoinia panamericana UAMH 10762]EMC97923.1 hypothetical protein BAUCODRAFT_146525 [Baudoinia panamericana UAMH 10762]